MNNKKLCMVDEQPNRKNKKKGMDDEQLTSTGSDKKESFTIAINFGKVNMME
jgi:hypothetical protein